MTEHITLQHAVPALKHVGSTCNLASKCLCFRFVKTAQLFFKLAHGFSCTHGFPCDIALIHFDHIKLVIHDLL